MRRKWVSVLLFLILEIMMFPGMLHLSIAKALVNENIQIGAQNGSATEKGAFTGEVPMSCLRDYGLRNVLVGHSERRNHFKETDEECSNKVKLAVQEGLRIIFCIGEHLTERQEGKTTEVLAQQLDAVLSHVEEANAWDKLVIAYEPVWAIGTGQVAANEQIQEAHKFIRDHIAQRSQEAAKGMQIIYGGSVTESNCKNILQMSEVDGFLVGSASTKPGFREIFETLYSKAKE